MTDDEGYWYCEDCKERIYEIVVDNVLWINIEYCPLCGAEGLKWIEGNDETTIEDKQ